MSARKGLLAMTYVVGTLVEVFPFTTRYIIARIPLPPPAGAPSPRGKGLGCVPPRFSQIL